MDKMDLKKVKRHVLEERIDLLEKEDKRKSWVKKNLNDMKAELERRKKINGN